MKRIKFKIKLGIDIAMIAAFLANMLTGFAMLLLKRCRKVVKIYKIYLAASIVYKMPAAHLD